MMCSDFFHVLKCHFVFFFSVGNFFLSECLQDFFIHSYLYFVINSSSFSSVTFNHQIQVFMSGIFYFLLLT